MSGQHLVDNGLEEGRCQELVALAASGNNQARDDLLELYRDRLRRMVAARMDRRLTSRVDASDIVQDATLEAAGRLSDYLADPQMDFYVWLRWITRDRMVDVHREHLGTLKRDARRDARLWNAEVSGDSMLVLANQLVADMTSPSNAAVREQNRQIVQQAICQLDASDREILMLRHFEHLTTSQSAAVLGLSKSGAGKRYVTALRKLRTFLEGKLAEDE